MNTELTIAIVTRRRPDKLSRCLKSIYKQSLRPKSVLIIDNDSSKSAFPIFKKYDKKLSVRYLVGEKTGVSNSRNIALGKANTKYLGFVDDDCILNDRWVENVTVWLRKNKNVAYVCGKTDLYNNGDILAIAQQTHDWYWYFKKLGKNNETTAEHFDTKNVVLNKDLILGKNLKFDPKCAVKDFDSADFDFGIQLNRNKLKGIYLNKLRLTHEETSTFKRYIMRAYYRGRIAGYINKKWSLDNKFVGFPERNLLIWIYRKIKIFPLDFARYTNNLTAPLYFRILVVIAILIYEGSYLKGYLSYKA